MKLHDVWLQNNLEERMIEGMDKRRLAMIRSLLKLIDEDTKFTLFFSVMFFMFAIF